LLKLKKHLRVLEWAKLVSNIWFDGLIEPGFHWEDEMKNHLNKKTDK